MDNKEIDEKIRAIEIERDRALAVIDRKMAALEGELEAIRSAREGDNG